MRKNPVPEREKQICGRLREFRLKTKLSQVAFAREVGLDSSGLASYEHARVPVRYRLAAVICKRFNLSQAWLAEGLGPPTPCAEIHPKIESRIPHGALLSEAYDKYLRGTLSMRAKIHAALQGSSISIPWSPPVGIPDEDMVLWVLKRDLDEVMQQLSPALQTELAGSVWDAMERFMKKHKPSTRKRTVTAKSREAQK